MTNENKTVYFIDDCIERFIHMVKKQYPGQDVNMRLTLKDGREVLMWFADTITCNQIKGVYLESDNCGFAGPVELIRNAFKDDACGFTFFVHK